MAATTGASVGKPTSESAEANRGSDFRRLWTAQSIALFGAEVTTLALPLAAALTLGASPWQMGLLTAAREAPFLLCTLPMGVLVDRVRRRPLLIAADLARAVLLCVIPIAAIVGLLRIELLYAIAFLTGTLSALFDVAHYAYVPALVPRDDLTAANSQLQVSYSAAESAGPGLAGVLIQWVSAPLAVLTTAATFLVSALLLGSIPQREEHVHGSGPRRGFRREATEGLRFLVRHPLLRPIVLVSAAANFFRYAVRAVYVLYATRALGLDATWIGIIFAIGGAAAIPGGLLAGWAARRFGFGLTVWGGWLVEGLALLLIPFAPGPHAIVILAGAQALGGFANALANVNQWSLRQVVTPDPLQGRVTAGHRFVVYGAAPLGALGGGYLASRLGMPPTLVIAALGAIVSPLFLLTSPVGRLGRGDAASFVGGETKGG